MMNNDKKLNLNDIPRVWNILPDSKKLKAVYLLSFMALGMLLEMLSIGLILPVLTVLTDVSLIEEYPHIHSYLMKIGNPSQTVLLVIAICLLVVIYIVKNSYLAFLAWVQSKFIYDTQAEMATSLFSKYLSQPYTFHLQRNSAELINNLQVELNLFITYVLSPGLLLIAEILVIFGLMTLLFYFEPFGSLVVISFFFLIGILYRMITIKRIKKWGEVRHKEEGLRMKYAQEGLAGIKDTKLYGLEKFFLKRYQDKSILSLDMSQKNMFIHNLTRLWLELLAILGIAILFFSMLYQGKTIHEIIPIIGLFAAVSFRLMPSMSRVVTSFNYLNFGNALIKLMENELKATTNQNVVDEKINKYSFHSDIALKDIEFIYPGCEDNAIKNITIHIPKGKMVGFIGESGSGKSTLADIITGLISPTKGLLLIDGKNIESNIRSWQKNIGYVPQSVYLTDDTLRNNIAFGIPEHEIDDASILRCINVAQLNTTVNNLALGPETILGERGVKLSGGQRQRVALARSLYHEPDVLVLDEATSALDNDTEKDVMNAIEQLHGKKTIIIIAHRLSTIQSCDIVYEFKSGKLINIKNK